MLIGYEFNFDLVIIFVGFDVVVGDEFGVCFVLFVCYVYMIYMLMFLVGGKVVVCLEGGYNLIVIFKLVLVVV